jgi:hypothetical protein
LEMPRGYGRAGGQPGIGLHAGLRTYDTLAPSGAMIPVMHESVSFRHVWCLTAASRAREVPHVV